MKVKLVLIIVFTYNAVSFAVAKNLRSRYTEEKEQRTQVNEIDDGENYHGRREISDSSIHAISVDNTIIANGKEYRLDKLEENTIFSPSFVMISDGKEEGLSSSGDTYWTGHDEGAELFMTKDENGNVEFLSILDGNYVANFAAVSTSEYPGLLQMTTESNELMTAMASLGNDFLITPYSDLSFMDSTEMLPTDDYNNIFNTNSGCNSYRQIDVAIAYDSSFCARAGGASNAWKKVTQIIGIASSRYRQQGLCLTLRASALEVNCDSSKDPYKNMRTSLSGCNGKGLVQDFTYYWHDNRRNISRDAAHLFTGNKFTDGMVGCAGIETLCKYAYGVESIYYTNDVTLQGILFAHELAHNCGAYHISNPSTIMNTYITNSPNGFAGSSVSKMVGYLNSQNCLNIKNR